MLSLGCSVCGHSRVRQHGERRVAAAHEHILIVSAARPVLVTVISRVAVVPRATVPKSSEPLTAILPVTPVPLAGSW